MTSAWRGCLSFAALSLVSAGMAHADSTADRLDRVERELNQLQRQVYRSEVGTPLPASPTVPAPSSGGGTQALDVQIRMDQIEAQMRTLTGKLEEVQYNISQLSNRLDKKQSDDELRFQQLESAQASPPPQQASVAPLPAKPSKPAASGHGAGDMDQ